MNYKVDNSHPHQATPMLRLGRELQNASSALVLLHGRGASAEDMIGLAQAFSLPDDMIVLAPQANSNIWYPQRLTAPLETNEPFLSSAILRVREVVDLLAENGIPAEKVIIGGFSQGASLSIEFLLRNPGRWAGLLAFSGGHIWPLGTPRQAFGALHGTPVFLGCSDMDPYIPHERFEESASLLSSMGARVTKQVYPGMGHTIIPDEIDTAQIIITTLN